MQSEEKIGSMRWFRRIAIVLVSAASLAGCGGGGGSNAAPAISSPSNPVTNFAPQAGAIYLGAWAKPSYAPAGSTSGQNIAALEASIGRKLVISLHYDGLPNSFPSAEEQVDLQNHRIPLVSLGCDDTDYNIANGSRDAVLIAKAAGIKSFGEPVLIRYKWEFNLGDTANGRTACADPARDTNGYFLPTDFIAAYRHIHDLMLAQGATNIVWVWNPSDGGVSGVPYWPGDSYVDWVGIDVYDRTSSGTDIFASPYALYAPIGNGTHPIIIGETGAIAPDQTNFLAAASVSTLRAQYPQIKALVYFDAVGNAYDYTLTDAGLKAFAQFAADPYLQASLP